MNDDTNPVRRRTYLKTVAGAGAGALLAGCTGRTGNGGGGGSTVTIGYSNFTNSIPFEVMVRKATEWYGQDRDDIEIRSTAADGTTSQQIEDCRNLLRQGVDGLIITPTDSNGLAKIAEEAAEQDVPTMSADIPVNSEALVFHDGVNQQRFGFQAGKQLLEVMNETFGADTDKKVLEILMDQDNSNAVLRHRFFSQAIAQSDTAEITKRIEIDGYSASEVASKATTWLQKDPELHGVFAPWTGGPLGVLQALEQQDMKHPVGEDGHIPIVNCDANAAIIDAIDQGFIDQTLDQPVQFYGPIAAHYMKKYLDAGKSADVLPSIGTQVAAEDLEITGGTHLGTEVWSEALWAPADVREFVTFNGRSLGFPFFTTNIPVITREDVDKPYLWGNLTREL